MSNEYISSENKLLIAAKLQKWIEELVKTLLWPVKETDNENISTNVRAIKYNVFENFGTMPIDKFIGNIKNI